MKKINYIGAVLLGSLALSLSPVCASAATGGNTEAVGGAVEITGAGGATSTGRTAGEECESQCGTPSAVVKWVYEDEGDSGWAEMHQLNVRNAQWDRANASYGVYDVEQVRALYRWTIFKDLTARVIGGWVDSPARLRVDGAEDGAGNKMGLSKDQRSMLSEIAGVDCGHWTAGACMGVTKWNLFALRMVEAVSWYADRGGTTSLTRWGLVDIPTSVFMSPYRRDRRLGRAMWGPDGMLAQGEMMPLAKFFNNVITTRGDIRADGLTRSIGCLVAACTADGSPR